MNVLRVAQCHPSFSIIFTPVAGSRSPFDSAGVWREDIAADVKLGSLLSTQP